MRCDTCKGLGKMAVARHAYSLPGAPLVWMTEPCPTCGGTGFDHCCSGDRAEPIPTTGSAGE